VRLHESLGWIYTSGWGKMKKLIVLFAVALTVQLLAVSLVGCQQQPQPAATPSLAIMVEANSVKAGSSFVVSGSKFKPHQKAFIELKLRASDYNMVMQVSGEADENGLFYSEAIFIPEDVVPDDYEVEIFTGKNIDNRELIAALPIHIQARLK